MLRPVIHHHIHNNAAATARATGSAVYSLSLDGSPLAARPPIAIKLVERILWMLLRMLLPLRITHPDAVRRLVILFLQRIEETADKMFFRPIAKPPPQAEKNQKGHDHGN